MPDAIFPPVSQSLIKPSCTQTQSRIWHCVAFGKISDLIRKALCCTSQLSRRNMNTEQLKQLEKDLWAAADNLRANTDLKSSEYATPVLGLIFLKFADNEYAQAEENIVKEHAKLKGARREKSIDKIAIKNIFDKESPESYGRIEFKEKCDKVFNLVVDFAAHGKRWVA